MKRTNKTNRISWLVLVPALILAAALAPAVEANELWVAPSSDVAEDDTGNFPIVADGDTHFTFHVPDNFEGLTSAKILMIPIVVPPPADIPDTVSVTYELDVSVAQNLQVHDAEGVETESGPITVAVSNGELTEIDVTGFLPALQAGGDYIGLRIRSETQDPVTGEIIAKFVGLRFEYVGQGVDTTDPVISDILARLTSVEAEAKIPGPVGPQGLVGPQGPPGPGLSFDGFGNATLASGGNLTLQPGPGKEVILENNTMMMGDATVMGASMMEGDATVMGSTMLEGDSTVMGLTTLGSDATVKGNAEILRDLKINGRLALPNTAAKIDVNGILQAAVPGAPLASTVNIIEVLNVFGGPGGGLGFIPRPPEVGTMMTLTYAPPPPAGDPRFIDFEKPPISILNCMFRPGGSPGTCDITGFNIVLKQNSAIYEMGPGDTITLVQGQAGIWHEVSRSSANISVFSVVSGPHSVNGGGGFLSIAIECVTPPEGNEKAIMLLSRVEINNEPFGDAAIPPPSGDLVIANERTILRTSALPGGPPTELHIVDVQNDGAGPGEIKLSARCMIP